MTLALVLIVVQDTRVYVSPQFTLGSLADLTVTRLCPSGWQAIGGRVDFETTNANVQVISDAPIVNGVVGVVCSK